MELSDKGKLICEAISDRRRLGFTYNKKPRIVEPQLYGIGKKGSEQLRAYQVNEKPELEKLFDVRKIESLELLPFRFEKPGPNYKKDDSAFRTVICRLE
jgi:hypothetical protein